MPISFTCPGCRAHLKVRDASFVGQTLDCPECRTPLLVATTQSGEVIGQRIAPDKPVVSEALATSEAQKRLRASSKPLPPPAEAPPFPAFPNTSGTSRAPQIVAWTVAAVCLLCLIPFLLPTAKPDSDEAEPTATTDGQAESTPEENVAPAESVTIATPTEVKPPALPQTPEGRLSELGKLLLERAAQEGHFPSGTVDSGSLPVAHRWSWQAKIAAERDNPMAFTVDWSKRWNDPAADPFVRRSIPRFQNPLAETQASEDKYPASHFVGVAGVGSDAPTLATDHPRAGIFGQDRKTKLQDIRDGASNTMLVAGVEQHPGSWAEGASSYRAFTREPYIHGPDGFGTGQQKSMLVLMADGSVKEINTEIDPRIVRRMAAMNDGLPLDPQVPGEPADIPTKPKPPLPLSPDATPDQVAIKTPPEKQTPQQVPPVKPASEVVVDIPGALSRKILSFDQSKPVAAYQLLLQIEELSAIRIDYDREQLGEAADRLDKPITLKMQNATLAELLNEILRQIDMKRQDEKSRIRIVAK